MPAKKSKKSNPGAKPRDERAAPDDAKASPQSRSMAADDEPSALVRSGGAEAETDPSADSAIDAGAAPSGSARHAAQSALMRLDAAETIEQAYDAWAELRLEHATFLTRASDERRRLDEQGGFLLGAVRAAAQAGDGSGSVEAAEQGADRLARTDDGLSQFLRETEQKLAQTRGALEKELAEEAAQYDAAFARIREAALHRIARVSEKVRPNVRLVLRALAGGRTILHVARPGPDEAVLLLHALNAGKAPTHYGYLFDDATDDVMLAPPTLYPEEGVAKDAVRPHAGALEEVVRRDGPFLPVKGHVPVLVGTDFFRLLQRGPVLEVEKRDGEGFRSVLTREEGERFAGHLLRLKLERRLDLELSAG